MALDKVVLPMQRVTQQANRWRPVRDASRTLVSRRASRQRAVMAAAAGGGPITGKTVAVTGAARGIGLEVCLGGLTNSVA